MRPIPLLILAIASAALAQPAPLAWDTQADTWVATDGLGRSLPTAEQTGPVRAGKTVGIFYFPWVGQHGKTVIDISKLLAQNPKDPQYGPPGAFHWWGQPLLGYYRSDDAFVIRKHAQMLADAGVDVLFLDVTNAFTYDSAVRALCQGLEEIRQSGQAAPKIAFIAHSKEGPTVQKLYDNFYAKKAFPELWFHWLGKPLLLAKPEALVPPLREFFTLRESWAWSKHQKWFGNGQDKWTWIDHYPQSPGWHQDPRRPEQISVCIAQHPTSNIGRSFHNGRQPPPEQFKTDQGLCFAEQWKRALEVDPQLVFVTGWNEWTAQRFTNGAAGRFLGQPIKKGDTFFVDQYNPEYSRDAEPMLGGHGDHYYYQLAANIRRFKGTRSLPAVKPRPIQVDGRFDDWKDVTPEFRDTIGDVAHRNHPSADAKSPAYTNTTGRNDIVAAKVSFDAQNLYFYAKAARPLTAPTDPNWMLLFIDADQNPRTGWLGYDLVINRENVRAAGRTTVQRHAGGTDYRWTTVAADVVFAATGSEIEIAIPRELLKSAATATAPRFIDFKWSDNLQQSGDWSDFTLHGDSAPNDRFNYRAILGGP